MFFIIWNTIPSVTLTLLYCMDHLRQKIQCSLENIIYCLYLGCLHKTGRKESLGFHLRWSSYCRYLSPLSFNIQESHSPLAGPALGEVGEAMRELSEVKDSLDMEVKQNFIDPLQNLHDKDLREIQVSATDLWEVTDLNLQT